MFCRPELNTKKTEMKKSILMVAAAAMIAGGMTSCKKGDNDAFLSLRSRKARVVGEWTIQNLSEVSSDNSSGSTETETVTVDGTSLTIAATSGGTTTTTTGTITNATMTFEKDGTWTSTIDMSVPYEISGVLFATVQSTSTENGTWNFLGKIDEFKNKERIVLNTLSSNSTYTSTPVTGAATSSSSNATYADGEQSDIMAIDELRNKKIVVNKTENSTSSETGGTSTTSSSEMSMTLVR
jgi:hypothetical protein